MENALCSPLDSATAPKTSVITLPSNLGIKLLIALVIGSTLGSGVFGLPQNRTAGVVLLGWAISGLGMLMLALVYQMLAVRKPALDNGVYACAQALSGPYVGFNSAWRHSVSGWIGNVGYLVAAFGALGYFVPAFGEGTSVAAIVGASVVLWLVHAGVLRVIQGAAVLNGVVTVAKVVPLVLFKVRAACDWDFVIHTGSPCHVAKIDHLEALLDGIAGSTARADVDNVL